MNILRVKQLCKTYPDFSLQNVSFDLPRGSIMGLIGRNGAGKSTTLKCLLHQVHPDAGTAEFFGLDIKTHENDVKQRIGYAGGAVDYYKKKKIRTLLEITKRFYRTWDDAVCRRYLDLFDLNENKTPDALSEGMKVKLNLVIALSHGAQLLILDEPTSGLDPVSRAELLRIFVYLKSQGISILFSTHITSDLDACADAITYIQNGRVRYTGSMADFTRGETLEAVMLRCEKETFDEKFTV